MLGNNRTMDFARVRERDLAIDQLRKHQLVYSSRRGVNPAQFLGCENLLRTNRPRNQHLGIGNLCVEPLVIGKVNNLEFRKVTVQPLGKPRRRIPLVERMVNGNKKLSHRVIG